MLKIKKEIRNIKRFEKIFNAFFKEGFGYYIRKLNIEERLKIKVRPGCKQGKKCFPKNLVRAFESCGGAFIKLGQLLSLRPDLIPKEYCDEFRKLQDNVRPFAYKDVKRRYAMEKSR